MDASTGLSIANVVGMFAAGAYVVWRENKKSGERSGTAPAPTQTVEVTMPAPNPGLPPNAASMAIAAGSLSTIASQQAQIDEMRAQMETLSRSCSNNAKAVMTLRRDEEQRSQEDAEFRADLGERLLDIKRKIRERMRSP